MAATNSDEFNSLHFMEEVQKYECLYNKFNKDYKNKFVRFNCWKIIAEQFNIDACEAEKKYKNIRTAYGRYLRKKKSIPSGSGRNAVPVPSEFANLDWLTMHINQRANTSTNMSFIQVDNGDEESMTGLDRVITDVGDVEEEIDDCQSVNSPLSCLSSPSPVSFERELKTRSLAEKIKIKSKRPWSGKISGRI